MLRTAKPHAFGRVVGMLAVTSLAMTGLAGCGTAQTRTADGDPADDATTSGSTSSRSPAPSQETTPPPSTPTSAVEPDPVTVPVYFVGDTPQGPRLFSELREVGEADPLTAAAALVTAGDPLDPDYRTLFPGGGFSDVEHEEAAGLIVVHLADDGWRTPAVGMDRLEAETAVQQVVYTLQGVTGTHAPVEFRLGDSADLIFGIDSAGGIRRAPQLDVLSLVNVTTPQEGATVSGNFTASGLASSFEATVPWEIRRGATVVQTGFATAKGWMGRLYPWRADVDVSTLAPGEYTFVALTDDPSGGAEGAGPTQDTKQITVGP